MRGNNGQNTSQTSQTSQTTLQPGDLTATLQNFFANPPPNANVSAVVLKLPQFWTNLPVEWFIQIEAQFATRGITLESTKFDYVVAALPKEVISSVLDILQTPPEAPYSSLKRALIDRLCKSESRRIEELLSGTQIGDRTPSDFFRYLKSLAGDSTAVNETLLQNLWLRNLPPIVQTAVKSSGKTVTADMLKVADDVYEVYQQRSLVLPNATPFSNLGINEIVAQNQQMFKEISALRDALHKLQVNRDRSRTRNRSKSRDRDGSGAKRKDLCWYHFRYGVDAKNCKAPCNFKNNPN